MNSSNMDKIFNYSPVPEETKSLSPLTYYQPFQSSFDPEFAMQPPKDTREELRMRWGHGVERQTGNLHMSGSRILNPCDLNQPGLYPQTSKTYPEASTSSWRSEDRNQPSVWCDYGPRQHPFPSYGDITKGLGSYTHFLQRDDNRGAGFGTLDSSCRIGSVQSTPEATGYSLLGSCGKNAFKTGHSRPMMCNFCKNNKEVPDIYLNHYLYDPETKVLTCPVLRKHVCEICGGTGDRAHTLQYCPVNRERGLQAKVPVLLKTRTITNSTGKIRRN